MPLTTPVISVQDDAATPTGAVVTVAGSDPASTNTASVLQWTHPSQNPGLWVSGGSRTGDGTLSLTLAKGYYWFRVDSVLASETTVSNLVYGPVTDGGDAVEERALAAVQAVLQGMTFAPQPGAALAGNLPPANIVRKKIRGVLRTEALPVLMIAPGGSETEERGTNVRDDIVYPVAIDIMDQDPTEFQLNLPTYLRWREMIARAFRWQRLGGVPEIWNCRARYGEIVKPSPQLYGVFWSALVLNFVSREVRGIGA